MPGLNLRVFRDTTRQIPSEELLSEFQAGVNDLNRSSNSELPLNLLLLAGKIESGLSDCSWQSAAVAGHLTDSVSSLLVGESTNPESIVRSFRELISNKIPSHLRVSDPEGFSYYALHPLDFSDAAASLYRDQRIAVIGIRTIGTILSSIVAVSLRQQGNVSTRITVRPTGHPYNRKTEFTNLQDVWVQEQNTANAQFLIVDEGPGLSGSSFLSVADALLGAGVQSERITLLGSNDVDPNRLCALDAAARWRRFAWRRVSSRITRRFENLVPFGGGMWRNHLYPARDLWPACWPEMERLKFMTADRKDLLKFAGLGTFGELAGHYAHTLSEGGFGPNATNAGDGMIAYEFIEGERVSRKDLSPQVLDRMASYCEFRAKEFATTEEPGDHLEDMANFNFAQEFRRELGFPEGVLQTGYSVIPDGHMQPHEWLRTTEGQWQKVDACSHGDDHFFPGPTDIAWDLAGAIVEWQMDRDAEHYLARKYYLLTGDEVNVRLSHFVLAYSIFRMAYCKMAFHATQSQSEKQRLQRAYLRYRDKAELQSELYKATLSHGIKSNPVRQLGGHMAKENDNEAKLDELGNDPAQVGPRSAGQSGDAQRLSHVEDAADESVEELADTDQAIEAATVEGIEDAADHPERPVHTHLEYGRPDDVPPRSGDKSDAA